MPVWVYSQRGHMSASEIKTFKETFSSNSELILLRRLTRNCPFKHQGALEQNEVGISLK